MVWNGGMIVMLAALSMAPTLGRPIALKPGKALPEHVLDRGTFVFTVNGKRAGQELFSVLKVGDETQIRTWSQHALDGPRTTISGTLRTDSRWRAVGGLFEIRAGGTNKKVTLLVNGGIPEVTTEQASRSISYTRPGKPSDLFLLNGQMIFAHLGPLCHLAGAHEKTLTAFPAAALVLSAKAPRSFAQTKLGAPGVNLTTVTADYAQAMRFELVCDGDMLVAFRHATRGLTAVRASYEAVGAALETRVRSTPLLPESLVDLPRRVKIAGGEGAGSHTLQCSLTVPKSYVETGKTRSGVELSGARGAGVVFRPDPLQPLPAVVLLGDAGPRDRDGNAVGLGDPNLSILKLLAIRLGETGVASIRCDRRNAGRIGATEPALQASVADARAIAQSLRQEPMVKSDSLGFIGYAEGSLVAMLASKGEPSAKVLVLLAAAGRSLDTLILRQTEAYLRRFGYPEDEIKGALAEKQAVYQAVRRGSLMPASLSPTERQGIQRSLVWIRSHLASDPVTAALGVNARDILIAHGERDGLVSIEDAEILRKALGKTGVKVAVKTYPDLNRLFVPTSPGLLTEYFDAKAEVAAVFLRDVALFANTALKMNGTTEGGKP